MVFACGSSFQAADAPRVISNQEVRYFIDRWG